LKVYIAADYARKDEVRALAEALEGRGVKCTSTWAFMPSDQEGGVGATATSPGYAAAMAAQDLDDVGSSDAFVQLTTGEYCRGGRQVELGMAMALGKRVIVVGPREHVFHWHPRVTVVDHWEVAEALIYDWAR
jgi:nucleoside 2-deoxyribosyltransferase